MSSRDRVRSAFESVSRWPWMARVALVLVLAYAALDLTGARDCVSVLSGTPVSGVPFALAAPGGALYVLAFLGAVLVAPILLIASAIAALIEAVLAHRRRVLRRAQRVASGATGP